MDWSKAKNILILAFIITNIFLAYALFSVDKDKDEFKVEDDFISEVTQLLLGHSIKIDTKVPKEIPSLQTVSLEYESYEPKETSKKLLGNYVEDYIGGVRKYRNGERIVEFFNNNKKLVYRDMELENMKNRKSIDSEEALEIAQEFINTHGFDLKDAKLNFNIEKDKVHTVEYSRVIDDTSLEETSMKIEVSSEGVISFERYWMKNVKKEDKILTVSSAPKALLRLLTREEYYGKTIIDIDICYYFDTEEYSQGIGLKESTGGVAVPTWRFIFSDGEKAFLEEN